MYIYSGWENIKSREVTGVVLESAPSAPPPGQFFSAGAETYYFKFQGGGILTGGEYAPPVFKQHMHPLPQNCAHF